MTKIKSDSKVKALHIKYLFYISNERVKINKYANCRIDNVVIKNATNVDSRLVSFTPEVFFMFM